MKFPTVLSSLLAGVSVFLFALLLTTAAASAKRPPTPGGSGGFSTTSTYVKNYANVLNGAQYDLTPRDVQATPDGGSISLATTPSATNGVGVAWLLKTSVVGSPQWSEEIGCLGTPPGDYSDAVALRPASNGGYVLAGGTVGCGSAGDCPSTSGFQCGLVEKLDSTGRVAWAQVYAAGADGTVFDQIESTRDGGYIAVGSAMDGNHDNGALIVKLDSLGAVEWQRQLGPTGVSYAFFSTVQQTSDGGYVAAGTFSNGSQSSFGLPLLSVLAAKFDAAGNLSWQRGYNDVGSAGLAATEHVNAIVQTADGGYAIGGDWNSDTSGFPGSCCQGALLLKLTPNGSIQWQQAYSGGVNCFSNGFNETCMNIGGGVYSLQQTLAGGYVLAGDSNTIQFNGLVPWLAKVDSSGALVWQENDYQVNPRTSLPLSEYFASSTLTAPGPLALGSTENYSNGLGELLVVQTDMSGTVGSCSQVHPATVLRPTNPGLVDVTPGLATTTSVASRSSAPVQTQATTATATSNQC